MAVGKVVYTRLIGGATAGLTGGRIYPFRIHQGAEFPAVSYAIISDDPTKSKSKANHVLSKRVQVDVFADSYKKVEEIAQAVRLDLDWFSGIVSSIDVDGISYLNETDSYNDEHQLYNRSIDFKIRLK